MDEVVDEPSGQVMIAWRVGSLAPVSHSMRHAATPIASSKESGIMNTRNTDKPLGKCLSFIRFLIYAVRTASLIKKGLRLIGSAVLI